MGVESLPAPGRTFPCGFKIEAGLERFKDQFEHHPANRAGREILIPDRARVSERPWKRGPRGHLCPEWTWGRKVISCRVGEKELSKASAFSPVLETKCSTRVRDFTLFCGVLEI